ncbi:MAG: hypothetical protein FJY95_05045 [Candidatus Handelsmanbacteria bacterium]|nr:hypothetical protein [Candidatus Handelsmanbacteria bacterium]
MWRFLGAGGLALLLGGAEAVGAHPNLVAEAARAQKPPRVDGDLGEWEGSRWLELAPGDSLAGSRLGDDGPGEGGVAGTAADLSARLLLAWDEQWLYLAAQVRDNVRDVDGGEQGQWFCRDGVALFLDVPRDADGPVWFVGDHAFVFTADPALPPEGRWWRHGDQRGRQEGLAPPQTQLAVALEETGYRLEAAIPMAVLSLFTPTFRAPFAGRTVGFMLLVTDPDGGPRPFGGQLSYGGQNDNDQFWAQLRLVEGGAAPPQLETSAEEVAFDAKMRNDQRLILPAYLSKRQAEDQVAQQRDLAAEYFQVYLDKRPSRQATRALSMAFTLWGNTRSTGPIREAIALIPPEEDVWDQVVPGLRQAFYLDGRVEEGLDLMSDLELRVTPQKSRSALILVLAANWLGQGQIEKAYEGFTRIVSWSASAWHVGEANRYLEQIDRQYTQNPDEAAPE